MSEINPFIIFIAAIFTNNILLSNFLGMCSFIAISKTLKASFGLGCAVTFVMGITITANWLVFHLVLKPLGLEYLYFLIFIMIIAALVQFVEMVVERYSPTLYLALGIFLPLITVNCAILGACLFAVVRNYTFMQSIAYGIGSGIGWSLAIISMAAIRQRLRFSHVPKALEGIGITMIITGIMALAFSGFAGVVSMQ
ncbi:MAG: NADH:ubiquinone reductase (Na(+)-transporting) subunit E [Candidatus Brocadiae bacterium]|nr:NADH:ubiquinone reductase (Na(+)-transporting) subunit E [Candidatus Brocadiia bacterium]